MKQAERQLWLSIRSPRVFGAWGGRWWRQKRSPAGQKELQEDMGWAFSEHRGAPPVTQQLSLGSWRTNEHIRESPETWKGPQYLNLLPEMG